MMKKIFLFIILLTSLTFGQSDLLLLFDDDGLPQPFSSDALFVLDGTIIDIGGAKYFDDKSPNGRNFLITSYDFNSDWTTGFPYKSASTISAPAGDLALITADINHYLYAAADSTPNQIPVVSLFQDVDYGHRLFTRHAAQVLDGNLIETYEPRVLDVVLYANTKAGADLTLCQTYYGVPAEDLTNVKWIDPVNGNDATGNGSKATPWQTLTKATTSASVGDTVYVKSGTCDISAAIWNSNKILYFVAIGYNVTKSSVPRTTFMYSNAGSMTGFNFDGTGITIMVSSIATVHTVVMNKCKFTGTTNVFVANVTDQSHTLTYCILTGYSGTGVFGRGTITLNTCLFNSAGKYAATNIIAAKDSYISNSKITCSAVLGGQAGYLTILWGDIFAKGNTITSTMKIFSLTSADSIDVSYNTITSTGGVLSFVDTPNAIGINIQHNTIVSNAIGSIFSFEDRNITLKYNHITHDAVSGNIITILGSADTVTIDAGYNSFNTLQKGSPFIIGDATFADSNKVVGNVYGNKFLGARHYGYLEGDTHGFSVWANKGVNFYYNFIKGWQIAIVLKGGNCDYSTNKIHHNVVIDGYITTRGIKNVPIYNNTFYRTTTDTVGYTTYDLLTDEVGNESLNGQIKNNIFICSNPSADRDLLAVKNSSTPVIDYNVVYTSNATIGYSVSQSYDFAGWQGLGYDVNSIELTPTTLASLFTNSSALSLSLGTNSVAIDAGTDLGSTYEYGLDASTDWGEDEDLPTIVTKQQTGTWDVGAYVR